MGCSPWGHKVPDTTDGSRTCACWHGHLQGPLSDVQSRLSEGVHGVSLLERTEVLGAGGGCALRLTSHSAQASGLAAQRSTAAGQWLRSKQW